MEIAPYIGDLCRFGLAFQCFGAGAGGAVHGSGWSG